MNPALISFQIGRVLGQLSILGIVLGIIQTPCWAGPFQASLQFAATNTSMEFAPIYISVKSENINDAALEINEMIGARYRPEVRVKACADLNHTRQAPCTKITEKMESGLIIAQVQLLSFGKPVCHSGTHQTPRLPDCASYSAETGPPETVYQFEFLHPSNEAMITGN